jgi:signal transduction histidine kinase
MLPQRLPDITMPLTPSTFFPPPDANRSQAEHAGVESLLARLMDVARASALEEMASGMAHELNQPLGAIATFAQAGERMLGKSPPMLDAATDVMRQISKEALGAGEGIRRIRRLFNREALQTTRCSMGGILTELAPLLDLLGARNGATLEIDVPAGVPDTMADPLRIQHVLFTLVQNAFEAERELEVAPVVKITVSSNRYSVEVGVIDNGKGIAEDAIKQLFRPFYTTKANGTGLGLASSRAIVEMHEGTIGFQSQAGATRFWFNLPATNDT